jgi:benzodiazapine receptor
LGVLPAEPIFVSAAPMPQSQRPESRSVVKADGLTAAATACPQIAAVGGPLLGGMVVGFSITNDILGWYKTLRKPSWTPPNWLFGPMWSVMYCAMGVASHRVWKAGGGPVPLTLYAVQLALNLAWSPIFFKAHNLKAASVDITALLGVLGATIYEFSKVDTVAAQLMLPYLGWVSFAAALTYNICMNNTDDGRRAKRAAADAAARAARSVEGAASEATAQAATPFLAQGGERQADHVPGEVADAAAARSAAARTAKQD